MSKSGRGLGRTVPRQATGRVRSCVEGEKSVQTAAADMRIAQVRYTVGVAGKDFKGIDFKGIRILGEFGNC
ncbi:MAG: hypothetical protein DHS20C16_31240 [Phycisphaerae bacterium]|nr:MAG: hypothetical protein DHS20C16_31240 [Phycisphaerae bacterium]